MEKKHFRRLQRWVKSHFVLTILLSVIPAIILTSLLCKGVIYSLFANGIGFTSSKLKGSTKIINAANNAFNLIYSKCPYSDEIRVTDSSCLNNSGFSASIVESLASLYILGQKENYKYAKEFVLKNFDCDELEWVNTRDFWTRGIASLISVYHISGDSSFLKRATVCATKALKISPFSSPFDSINFKEETGSNAKWKKGTLIGDAYAGYPEALALSLITKDKELKETLEEEISYVTFIADKSLPLEIDILSDKEIRKSNEFLVGHSDFLHRMVISLALKENEDISTVISQLDKDIKLPGDYQSEAYYPLLDSSYLMKRLEDPFDASILNKLESDAKNDFIFAQYSNQRIKNEKKNPYFFNFEFDGIRHIVQNLLIEGRKEKLRKVKAAFENSFILLKSGKGYVGLKTTMHNKVQKGQIMPSNFFGQWLFQGSLLLSDNNDMLKDGIFNENGHLLMYNKKNPFNRN